MYLISLSVERLFCVFTYQEILVDMEEVWPLGSGRILGGFRKRTVEYGIRCDEHGRLAGGEGCWMHRMNSANYNS